MEDKYIAGIIVAALAVFIGLALWPAMSSNIGTMTQTQTVRNHSITFPAAGATVELLGQDIVTDLGIYNRTDGTLVPTNNYTITSEIGTNGLIKTTLTGEGGHFSGVLVNASYTYQPEGYARDSGSRAIIVIVAIMMALLIAVSASPNLRDWIGDLVRG